MLYLFSLADLCKGGFFMPEKVKNKKKVNSWWKRLLFSQTLADKNAAHRIAYIGVVTAFIVAANALEFKFFDTQFSFTIVVSALAGIIIGPLFGFVACFVGDLAGYLINSSGMAYMPWVGLSTGLMAFIAGFIVGGVRTKRKWMLWIKLALTCILIFGICTVAINTTAFCLLYSKVSYLKYFTGRMFVQGQIWNNVFNYVLLFIVTPILPRIKPLKIKVN